MTPLERCHVEQAICAAYLRDPAKLAEHAREMRCTVERERAGVREAIFDWYAEEVLIRLEDR